MQRDWFISMFLKPKYITASFLSGRHSLPSVTWALENSSILLVKEHGACARCQSRYKGGKTAGSAHGAWLVRGGEMSVTASNELRFGTRGWH